MALRQKESIQLLIRITKKAHCGNILRHGRMAATMKLDILIRLLDGHLNASQSSFQKILNQKVRSISISDVEVDDALEDQPPYKVELSDEVPSLTQHLSEEVLKENASQAQKNGSYLNIPPSLTANLEKPHESFDRFFSKLTRNPLELVKAHGELDRNRILKLLTS